jgi:hypothetical protein
MSLGCLIAKRQNNQGRAGGSASPEDDDNELAEGAREEFGKERAERKVSRQSRTYFYQRVEDNAFRLKHTSQSLSRSMLKTAVLSTTPCKASVPGPLPNATTSSTVTNADFV